MMIIFFIISYAILADGRIQKNRKMTQVERMSIIIMMKEIVASRWFKAAFSVGLLYLAFRKVDIVSVGREMLTVPWWFVVVNFLISVMVFVVSSARWANLLLPKIELGDVVRFTKSTFIGMYYSIFFPTMIAGDFLKWPSLTKKYPSLSKTLLLGSALVDRVVGFSTFILVALVAVVLGKVLGYRIEAYLVWLFGGLFAGVIFFYIAAYTIPFEKISGKWKVADKLIEIATILKKVERRRLMVSLALSVFCEMLWIFQIFLISVMFNSSFGLLNCFIYLPVIGLILVLPISIAGFGAREQLYLIFFSGLGLLPEKILSVSTFLGLTGIFCSVVGGILTFF